MAGTSPRGREPMPPERRRQISDGNMGGVSGQSRATAPTGVEGTDEPAIGSLPPPAAVGRASPGSRGRSAGRSRHVAGGDRRGGSAHSSRGASSRGSGGHQSPSPPFHSQHHHRVAAAAFHPGHAPDATPHGAQAAFTVAQQYHAHQHHLPSLPGSNEWLCDSPDCVAVRVHGSPQGQFVALPRSAIISWPDAASAMPSVGGAGSGAPSVHVGGTPASAVTNADRILCPRFDARTYGASCPLGHRCHFVHADTSQAMPVNAHVNYAWRSVEAVTYPRFASGQRFEVAAPNSKSSQDVMNSDMALQTQALLATRRPLTHCAHYYYNRVCRLGAQCRFIHAVFVDPSAKEHQRAPAPIQLGRSGEGFPGIPLSGGSGGIPPSSGLVGPGAGRRGTLAASPGPAAPGGQPAMMLSPPAITPSHRSDFADSAQKMVHHHDTREMSLSTPSMALPSPDVTSQPLDTPDYALVSLHQPSDSPLGGYGGSGRRSKQLMVAPAQHHQRQHLPYHAKPAASSSHTPQSSSSQEEEE